DLVPFHMMLVEQCQPLRHSSLHNHKQVSDYEGMEYILQDHNYDTHGEGDSQMGTLLVKQESVLKEEEVESTVVSGQVLSDKAVSSQTFEQKRAAVVRLNKLRFPISTKESVLVSEWPKNRSSGYVSILKEGSTHEKSSSVVISKQQSEMLVLSSDICTNFKETSLSVSVNTSQMSEEKSTIAIHTTQPSAVSGTAGECTSDLDKEIRIAVQDCALPNEGPAEEKPSDAIIHLTSITSKDTSDPHFQMTKTQFLAQLAVAPVTQDQKQVSSNDSVDTRASCAETNISDKKRLQKTSLLAQLRSHVQTHLQAKRTETNPEPCTETDTQTGNVHFKLKET
ncbi:hypothetical protein GBF38_022366, partial [Nibea albiflora]